MFACCRILTIFVMQKIVREKLGNYLLDVSKYVLTAVLITTSFTDLIVHRWLVYLLAAFIVLIALIWGLFYLKS